MTMKKLIIAISPILAAIFILKWAVFGLKDAIAYLIATAITIILILGIFKWVDFVDKHIKD